MPRTIELLPNVEPTPQLVLAELSEGVGDFDAIAVVVMTKDGDVRVAWSTMQSTQLIGLATLLQDAVVRNFCDDI